MRLSLTQPAVSQHLKKLETESGKRLLRRLGLRFELTNDSRALCSIVERMVHAERDAAAILRPRPGGSRGTAQCHSQHGRIGIENRELRHELLRFTARGSEQSALLPAPWSLP